MQHRSPTGRTAAAIIAALALGAFAGAGIQVEGAAAAALAALPQIDADPVVLVVTGRNIDPELARRAIDHPESFPD